MEKKFFNKFNTCVTPKWNKPKFLCQRTSFSSHNNFLEIAILE